MFNKFVLAAYIAFLLPSVVCAQHTIGSIINVFVSILTSTIPVIMVLALLAFTWGAVKLIYGAGDDRARAEGKQTMVWGALALFLMVSVWGIVEIIKITFFGDL